LERALRLADGLNEPSLRSSAYEQISARLVEQGALERALEFAEKADGTGRARALAHAASVTAERGEIDRAKKILTEIERDLVWAGPAQLSLVRALLAHKRNDEAFEIATSVAAPEFRYPLIAEIATRIAEPPGAPDPAGRAFLARALVPPAY
jgi:hypothetical protein